MKKVILALLLFVGAFQMSQAQYQGAFTDVFVRQISFPDIPEKVVTYVDSQSVFFFTVTAEMHRTFDANGYLSNCWAFDSIFGLYGVSVNVTPSLLQGATPILTLTNKLTAAGSDDYTRERIQYNANNQVVNVYIDTVSEQQQWGTKYAYTYTYNQAGRVVSWLKKKNYYGVMYNNLLNRITYAVDNKPSSGISISYNAIGTPTDSSRSTYYYTAGKVDSLVTKNNSIMGGGYKYVPHYLGSKIYQVDTYSSYFGEEMSMTGSSWFYETDVTALEEEAMLNSVKVVNPVRNSIEFTNAPDLEMELLDLNGKLVLSSRTTQSTDVSNLPKGLYVMRLYGEKASVTKKVTLVD